MNPIEEVFAMAKLKIKKFRLDQILNNTDVTMEDIIDRAFDEIDA